MCISMERLVKVITTFFYLGYSPVAPGTAGSLGGLLVYLFVKDNPVLYAISAALIFAFGMAFSTEAENLFGRKDHPRIVIDEALGMMLSLAFLPFKLWIVILGFLLFRLFDILKPPPIRNVEDLTAPYGIMLDDIIAAMYTNIILQFIVRLQKS